MLTQKEKQVTAKARSTKYLPFRQIQKLSQKLKEENKRIVFTTGTFDLLNPGHCRYLAEAKSKGDVLVVGVSTDYDTRRIKGPLYPLINEEIRSELVTHLRSVDYVVLTAEDSPHAVLSLLQPDIYFTSEGAWTDGIRDEQEEFLIKSYGGKLLKVDRFTPYFGTESLVEHMANIRVLQILEGYLKSKVSGFSLDANVHLPPAEYGTQIPRYKKAFDANKLIIKPDDLQTLSEKYKRAGKSVVFVSGSYDLLHTGHARFIEKAGLLGDVLVVGIPSDQSIRRLKGLGRPVISEHSRAYVLAHLDVVNHVVIFDDNSILASLDALKPDVFFTVDESWNAGLKQSPEYKTVKEYGGKVIVADRQAPFLSSSAIINKIAGEKVKEIFKECMDEERYKQIVEEKSVFIKSKKKL